MAKVDLPSGGWAMFPDDCSTIKNRERRAAIRVWQTVDGSDTDKGIAASDHYIALFCQEWSLPLPLPRDDLASLEDISGHDYDVLLREALRLQKELFLRFDPSPDATSPTGPSNG